MHGSLQDAYGSGREIHQAAALVNATSSKLQRKEQELEQIRSSLTGKTSELVGPDAPAERRLKLVMEIRELTQRRDSVEYQIGRLSTDLELHREELAELESYSTY